MTLPMTTEEAFREWVKAYNPASAVGSVEDRHRATFEAGINHALHLTGEGARKGSEVRGRVVVCHRPLWPAELEREGVPRDVSWPCLELDDGTIVFPPFAPKVTGPFFLAYKPSAPEGERKVILQIKHVDRAVGPQEPTHD